MKLKISKSIGIVQRVSHNLPTCVLLSLYYIIRWYIHIMSIAILFGLMLKRFTILVREPKQNISKLQRCEEAAKTHIVD